jgi:putative endonuclease
MKCCMYILKNLDTSRYYIGSTTDFDRRLKQHKNGHTRTTKVLETYTLVYKEEFDTIEEARVLEKKLKSYKSRKYIEWLINTGR